MQRLARIDAGRVAEIVSLPDDADIAELFHPSMQIVPAPAEVAEGWLFDDGSFLPPLPPPAPSQAELIVYLKNRRWQREIAGVAVEIGGDPVLVSTARGDDRDALHTELTAITLGLRSDGDTFNFADGVPRSVTNADMQAAIFAAQAHVRAAFNLEYRITASVDAGEIATLAEIDEAFV